MSKKQSRLTFCVLAFVFLVVAGMQVNTVKGNMFPLATEPPKGPPIITMVSPAQNDTVSASSELNLTYAVDIPASWKKTNQGYSAYLAPDYSPIEKSIGYIDLYLDSGYLNNPDAWGVGLHTSTLKNLSEGNHTVTISVTATVIYRPPGTEWWWYSTYQTASSVTLNFTVDITPPRISVLSPQNSTYGATDAALSLSVNEPTSWMGYILDGRDNVTLVGNTTLTHLVEGTHSLRIYGNDTAGNMGASEKVSFAVTLPSSGKDGDLNPQSYAYLGVAAVAFAIVSVAVIVLLRKRSR